MCSRSITWDNITTVCQINSGHSNPSWSSGSVPVSSWCPAKPQRTKSGWHSNTRSISALECARCPFTFLSAPAVLQACLSSGLSLEESAAKAWMNWRLYSIFTTQVKCSAKRDILNHFSMHRITFKRGRKLFHFSAAQCVRTDAQRKI